MKSRKNAFGKKESVSSRQCTSLHIRYRGGQINKLKFELLPHAPYLPDLAPSDYFLFPNLKKWIGGKRFANNKEVESAVDGYFEALDGSHYKQGIEAIEHSWEKCVELKGDYVEK